MKLYLTFLLCVAFKFIYPQFNDSLDKLPCRGLSIYHGKPRSYVKEANLFSVDLPTDKTGIAIIFSTVLTREDLHFSMPLDTIFFIAADDTLTIFDLIKDTIAYDGAKSSPEKIYYYIYWRALKELNDKEVNFLTAKQLLSIKVTSSSGGRNFNTPLPCEESQNLFKRPD